MLNLLAGLAESIGKFVLNALIDVVNLLIVAVGALIGVLFAVLPNMPDAPGPPDQGWLEVFAYFVPVGAIVAMLGLFLAAYVALLVIRIALRWVKAL
jgi:hypothetical protein